MGRNRTYSPAAISLCGNLNADKKKRLDPGTDTISFLNLVLSARKIKVLPITPEIAYISSSHKAFVHHDPADRLIAATTLHYKGALITCDGLLGNIKELHTIW